MSGLSDLMKKDISFKRKPSTKTAKAPKSETPSAKAETPSTETKAVATTEGQAPIGSPRLAPDPYPDGMPVAHRCRASR